MRRILGLICLTLLMLGCDDGEFSVTTFNFQTQNLSKCDKNTFLYKVEGNETMILEIPLSNFKHNENRDENNQLIPYSYTLTSADKLIYRRYDSTISSANLCASFPISDPKVLEEWTALAGAKIEILSYANHDSQNGGILEISGFTHHIVLKEVIFKKGDNQIVYEEYDFGNYVSKNLVRFDFTDVIQKCANNNLLYKLSQNEAIVMDLDYAFLFKNEATNGTPRTALIDGTTNRVIYKVFDANITGAYFCSTIPQTAPNIVEEWYAENGEEGLSGIIEVETEVVYDPITTELSGYIHHLTLKNTLFYNNNSYFFFQQHSLGNYGVEVQP